MAESSRTCKAVNLDDVLKTKAGQLASNAHLLEAKPGRFVPPPVTPEGPRDRPAMRLGIQPSTDEAALNKTETAYLGWLRTLGDDWIGIQSITLKLSHDCRLTMDFAAIDGAGLRMIDTKATNRKTGKPLVKEDAMIKMRVAARLFPFIRFLVAYKKEGEWKHDEIKP